MTKRDVLFILCLLVFVMGCQSTRLQTVEKVPNELFSVWKLQRIELADGSTVLPYQSEDFSPFVELSSEYIEHLDGEGWRFDANMGCNAMNGTYIADANKQLQFITYEMTAVGCMGEVAEDEELWKQIVSNISSYELTDSTLQMFTASHDTLFFVSE